MARKFLNDCTSIQQGCLYDISFIIISVCKFGTYGTNKKTPPKLCSSGGGGGGSGGGGGGGGGSNFNSFQHSHTETVPKYKKLAQEMKGSWK
jgi:hypothetical protein